MLHRLLWKFVSFLKASIIAALLVSAFCVFPDVSSCGGWTKVFFTGKDDRCLCIFHAELAVTPEERTTGLMFRQSLDKDKGMLFVFEKDELQSFWMINTYIPLDMIFINSKKEVVHIHCGAKPFDETSIFSGSPARYVLEVNAGRAHACGIKKGARMTIADTR